ncbi:uncharacterized protein LOC133420893 [Cololabis saira]|uniref:uncharacterized protein LOC133420893 n=1 Tax=Cololabis saira TaxID=129043 RepID=UPI002AD3EF7E|nr:uncharacterized protein LOC133420893 [Cololabis saira]
MEEEMKCLVKTSYTTGSLTNNYTITVFLVKYETQAQAPRPGFYDRATIIPYVNEIDVMDTIIDGKKQTTFAVLSGCRTDAGVYIMAGLDEDGLECGSYTCSVDSVLSVKGCPANEHCDSIGMCQPNICTLTGPTVIDLHGDVTSVKDRCTYSLMSDKESYEDFEVLASYKDRRRTDVSFVDSVTLKDTDITVLLEQGGRVKVGGSLMDLRKTQAGVFAKLQMNDSVEVTLFFDGNTAQLQTTSGSDYYPPDGLCGDGDSASSTNQTDSSRYHVPLADSDACVTTGHSSCHAAVTPDPYITACSDTMCKYPDEDGLMCQFLEAYARACSLMGIQLEEWRSNQECSTPQISCEDSPCSDHEFCGLVIGSPTCLCRAIFASSYRESGALGDPTVCTGDSASVSLVNCLLEEKGIDYSTLHLIDDTCTGVMDESHMVTFSFDNNCGTELEEEESKVSYKNTIKTTSSSSSVITRHNEFKIDFSCVHVEPNVKTMGFTIKDSSVSQVVRSEAFSYTVTMNAYTDAERQQAVDSTTEVLLDQSIWRQ